MTAETRDTAVMEEKTTGAAKSFRQKNLGVQPSPNDMLNGPCHIHSAFVDGKRVSRHAMKDCTTFLKLQEAGIRKQVEAKRQGYEGNINNAPTATQQTNNGDS
jgi:hypothetical protein